MQVLKDAWLEDNVAQCGYCRAGQLMTASALVNRNKHPGEQQIDRAMADNICRCGAYECIKHGINNASLALAKEVTDSGELIGVF